MSHSDLDDFLSFRSFSSSVTSIGSGSGSGSTSLAFASGCSCGCDGGDELGCDDSEASGLWILMLSMRPSTCIIRGSERYMLRLLGFLCTSRSICMKSELGPLEHLAYAVNAAGRRAARRGGGRLLGIGEAGLKALVGGVEGEALLVGGDGARGVAEAEVGGSEAGVPLSPVGLQLDGLLGVGERLGVAVDRGERGGAVGVEDVVPRGERDGVGEVPRRLLVAAGREGRITLRLRLVGHGTRRRSDRRRGLRKLLEGLWRRGRRRGRRGGKVWG
uniref:Uncharacterized protein n=1 Tax=Oryza glumipatula TaxID=40148 RepID=A0A0D9YVM2_9ORYZ